MFFINLLKKLPIDVGQARLKHKTSGKRIAFSFVNKSDNGLALDIGCRDGYWSDRLKKEGYEVKSLDIEPKYFEAIVCNVEDGIPFEKNTFDLIWCTEVIEHLYKPSNLIYEIDRVLKPGGTAILTTPNSAWWMYPLVRIWGWTPKKIQNFDHKQFFRIKDLQKIASDYRILGYFPYLTTSFRIQKFVGFLSPTFILIYKK